MIYVKDGEIRAKQHKYVVMFAEDYLREKGLWADFLESIKSKAEAWEAEERKKDIPTD